MCKQKKKTPAAIFINSRQRHPIEWSLTLIAQDKIAGHGLPYKLMNDKVYTHNLVTWDHWNQKYTLTCNSPKTFHFNSKNTTKRVESFWLTRWDGHTSLLQLPTEKKWQFAFLPICSELLWHLWIMLQNSTHLLWASMTLMNHVTQLPLFCNQSANVSMPISVNHPLQNKSQLWGFLASTIVSLM
jgi:hypothetical protein